MNEGPVKHYFQKAVAVLLLFVMCFNIISCDGDIFGAKTPVSMKVYVDGKATSLIESSSFTLVQGKIYTVNAEIGLKGGGTSTDVKWETEGDIQIVGNPSSGTIQVQILGPGMHYITAHAMYNGKSAITQSVTFNIKGYVESLKIQKNGTIVTETINMTEGETVQLVPVFEPSTTTQTNVQWSTDNDKCVTISSSGNLVAKSPGEAVITLRSLDNTSVYTSVNVRVETDPDNMTTAASSLQVNPTAVTLVYGDAASSKATLTATVSDGYGNIISTGEVSWESSDEDAVSVVRTSTRTAQVSAAGAGSAVVTATFVDTSESTASTVKGTSIVDVKGALESIKLDSDTYTFGIGYETGKDDIVVLYNPTDTTQRGVSAVSSDPEVVKVVSCTEDYIIVSCLKEGSADLKVTSTENSECFCTSTIIVKDMVSPADRISSIKFSKSQVTIQPPYDEYSHVTLSAQTYVFQDSSTSTVAGDPDVYGIDFEISDESVAVIEVSKDDPNTVVVKPVSPGTAVITATSKLVPTSGSPASSTCTVVVAGKLERLIANPASISVEEGKSEEIKISPYPANAVFTIDPSKTGTTLVSAKLGSNLNAELGALAVDAVSNIITLPVKGKVAGTDTISILMDGTEVQKVKLSVTPAEGEFLKNVAFSSNSLILRQDADTTYLEAYGINQDGEKVSIKGMVDFYIVENGNELSVANFDKCDSLDVSISSDSSVVSLSPKNAGTAIIKMRSKNDSSISASCIVQVGAEILDGELSEIRPSGSYFQIKLNGSTTASVNFVPADYEDKRTDWSIVPGADEKNVTLTSISDTMANIIGTSVGRDDIYVRSVVKPSIGSLFTVEVVNGDAYAITLDKYYLAYDRNQKADPVITATLTKNGSPVSGAVNWSIEADSEEEKGGLVSISPTGTNGNKCVVRLVDSDVVGTAYIVASYAGNEEIRSECLVHVVDSYSADTTPRILTTSYDSIVIEKGKSVSSPYMIQPLQADQQSDIVFSYSANGIVSVSQDKEKGEFVITALDKGTAKVTATVKDTDASCVFSVSVTDPSEDQTPSYISISSPVVNLSQEKMGKDNAVSIYSAVMNAKGTELSGKTVSYEFPSNASKYFEYETNGNELLVWPVGAGSSYVRVTYPGLTAETIQILVAAEEVIFNGPEKLIGSTSKLVLDKGSSGVLSVTAIPSLGDGVVSWASSAPGCVSVTVSEDDTTTAVVKGLSYGSSNITAQIAGTSISVVIPVEVKDVAPDEITGITVVPSQVILDLDSKNLTRLEAVVYVDGVADASRSVEWEIDDSLSSDVVSVTKDGRFLNIVKGTSPGSGYVTALASDDTSFSSKAYIDVVRSSEIASSLQKIYLNASHRNMSVTEEFKIVPTVVPASVASDVAISYISSDTKVATVTSDGLVKAVAAGSATIDVRAVRGDETATATFTVDVVDDTSYPVEIRVSDLVVNLDQKYMDRPVSVYAEVMANTGYSIPDAVVTFKPSSVADRYFKTESGDNSNELVLYPVNAGRSYVTVSYPGVPDEVITVIVAAQELATSSTTALVPSTNTLRIKKNADEATRVYVSAVPSLEAGRSIVWTTEDPEMLTLQAVADDQCSILVKGLETGSTKLYATLDGTSIRAVINIEVRETLESVVTGMSLVPQNVVIDLDSKALTQLEAHVLVDGKPDDSRTVSWDYDEDLEKAFNIVPNGNNFLNLTLVADPQLVEGYVTASDESGDVSAKAFVQVVRSSEMQAGLSSIIVPGYKMLELNSSYEIPVTVIPASISGDVDLVFSSANESVVMVDENERAIAVGSGKTTVNVIASYMDGAQTASASIVIEVPAESKALASYIELDRNYAELSQEKMDEAVTVTASVKDALGNTIPEAKVTFNNSVSSAKYIRTVVSGNVLSIYPVSAGQTYVTVSYPGVDSQRIDIYVTSPTLVDRETTSLVADSGKVVMQTGTEEVHSVTPVPGMTQGKTIVWTSSADDVVAVSADSENSLFATFQAKKQGTAMITATLEGTEIKTTYSVEVFDVLDGVITGISVQPLQIVFDLDAKDLTEIKASVLVDGVADPEEKVEWSVSTEASSIAQVTTNLEANNGRAVLKKTGTEGSGWIKVSSESDPDFYANVYVEAIHSATLEKELKGLYVSGSTNITLAKGTTHQMTVVPSPSAISGDDGLTISYTSSNESIASVTQSGLVTAVGAGSATITASAVYENSSGKVTTAYAKLAVTVPAGEAALSHIKLSKNTITLDQTKADQYQDVTATVMASSATTGNVVTWKLPDASTQYQQIADVRIDRNTISFAPLSAGRFSVYAEYPGLDSVELLVIVGEEKTSYSTVKSLTPSVTGELSLLYNSEFTVYVTPLGGSADTLDVTWKSSDDTVLEVVQSTLNPLYAVFKSKTKDGSVLVTCTGAPKAGFANQSTVSTTFRVKVSENGTGLVSAVSVRPSSLVVDLDSKALPTFYATAYVDGKASSDANIAWIVSEDSDESVADSLSFRTLSSNGQMANVVLSTDDSTAQGDGYIMAFAKPDGGAVSTDDAADDDIIYGFANVQLVRSSQIADSLVNIRLPFSENVSLTAGDSLKLGYTINPTSLQNAASVEWTLSETGYVEIVNGYLVARKATAAGAPITVTATATYDGKIATASFKVSVSPATYSTGSIAISPSVVEFASNTEQDKTVNATVFNTKGEDVTSSVNLTWTVENDSIATITPTSAAGAAAKVHPVAESGTTRFTVTEGTTSAEGYIVVGEVDDDVLVSLIANPKSFKLSVNEQADFDIEPYPSSMAGKYNLHYTMSTDSVEIDKAAMKVKAVKEGSSVITVNARSNDGKDTNLGVSTNFSVTVSGVAYASRIELDRTSVAFSSASTPVEVYARIISSNGKDYAGNVVWSVDDPSIATISVDKDDPNKVVVSPAAIGTTTLAAKFGNLTARIPVSYAYTGESEVKAPTAIHFSNSIILNHPDAATSKDKTASVSVIFSPSNLKDEYKTVVWSINGSSIAFVDGNVNVTSDGTISIKSVSEGVSRLKATSMEDPTVSAEVTVTVLPADVVLDNGIPKVNVSMKEISLEADGVDSEHVTVTVTDDGGDVAGALDALDAEVRNTTIAKVSKVIPGTYAVTSTTTAGTTEVVFSYKISDDVSAEGYCVVETNTASEIGKTLKSIDIGVDQVRLIAKETYKVAYSLNPNIAGIKVGWSTSNPSVATVDDTGLVTAVGKGSATITALAEQNIGSDTYTAKDTLSVVVTDSVPESSVWESFSPSAASLTLSPSDLPTDIDYVLTEKDSRTVNMVDEPNEIKVVGVNGDEIANIDVSKVLAGDSSERAKLDNDLFSISLLGTPTRKITVTPKNPGAAYLDVYVYDDKTDHSKGAAIARTYISITGAVSNVAISSQTLYLAIGDSETVNVDVNPSGAVMDINDVEWTLTPQPAGGKDNVILSNESTTSVTLRAVEKGVSVLGYKYQAPDNTTHTASVIVTVLDRDEISGGVRKLSFPESYVTVSYPYERTMIGAVATFFDGSTATDGIKYSLSAVGGGIASDIGVLSSESPVNNDKGVYFTGKKAGSLILTAEYTDTLGNKHEAKTTLIVEGPISSITTSYRQMILYTGGSSVVTAEVNGTFPDNVVLNWSILNEKNSDGSAAATTAFENLLYNSTDGTNVIIGTKGIVVDKYDPKYDEDLLATYPRTAQLKVTAPGYDIEAVIDVEVRPISVINSYPTDLQLSISGLQNLNPPFVEGQLSVEATVLNTEGNETKATIDWYYYPIERNADWQNAPTGMSNDPDTKVYKYTSWINPNGNKNDTAFSSSNYVNAFAQEDTSVLYYTPLKAGTYRLKAIVRENPILQAEFSLIVTGDVTSLTADCGNRVSIVKDDSLTINAVYTPEEALARSCVWILEDAKNSTSVAYNSNKYISFIENGNSISLKAEEQTTKSQIIWLEYWDSETQSEIDELKREGKFTSATYKTATSGKNPLFSYAIAVDVAPKDKTIQTFSFTGITESIDPSSIESVVSFGVASQASGNTSSSSFSNWEWIDVDVVGNETGMVYATTRKTPSGEAMWGFKMGDDNLPVKDGEGYYLSTDGLRLYDKNGNKVMQGGAWNGSSLKSIASGGKINSNSNAYSFILDQNGIPSEPVVLVAHLKDGYEDGYTGDAAKEEGYIFDTDTLGFNSGRFLVYIGGLVSSISPSTTTYNLNNNEQTSEGSNIDLILGATARLTLKYNPSYTHQKGALWFPSNDYSFTDFAAMAGSDQCSLFAKKQTSTPIVLCAVSIYDPWFDEMAEQYGPTWKQKYLDASHEQHVNGDPEMQYPSISDLSIYTLYQVTIKSPIEQTMFTAKSQTQTNKDSGQLAEYSFINDPVRHPDMRSLDEVYCYDTTDSSGTGEGGSVDAYYIETELTPDYGYSLEFIQNTGSKIGTIDTTNEIDSNSNDFRFIPKGNALSSKSVSYGTIEVKAVAADLNYSKIFRLHYLPSNFRVVKYIGEKSDGSVIDGWDKGIEVDTDTGLVNESESGEWDVYENTDGSKEILGMDALYLYPGEEFDLSIVSFTDNPMTSYLDKTPYYVGNGVPSIDETKPADDPGYLTMNKYAIMYSVYDGVNQDKEAPGYLDFDVDGDLRFGDFNPDYPGDYVSEWYLAGKNKIKALKEGAVYVSYTVSPIIYEYEKDEYGNYVVEDGQYVIIGETISSEGSITGGFYVYIVSPVNQVLALAANGSINSTAIKMTPKVSAGQRKPSTNESDGETFPSHWYLGQSKGAVKEELQTNVTGSSLKISIYRGRAVAAFDTNGVNLSSFSEETQGQVSKSIATQSGSLIINAKDVSKMSIDKNGNSPSMSDVVVIGDYGIQRFQSISTISITDDGGLVKSNLDKNGVFDLSTASQSVKTYTHTGMKSVSSSIKKIKLPSRLTRLELNQDNELNCTIDWNGSQSYLTTVDLSGNKFDSLTISGFPVLKTFIATGTPSGLSSTTNRTLTISNAASLYDVDLTEGSFNIVKIAFPKKGSASYNDSNYQTTLSATKSVVLREVYVSGAIRRLDVAGSVVQKIAQLDAKTGNIENGNWIKALNLENADTNETLTTLSLDCVQSITTFGSTDTKPLYFTSIDIANLLESGSIDMPYISQSNCTVNIDTISSKARVSFNGSAKLTSTVIGTMKSESSLTLDEIGVSSLYIDHVESNVNLTSQTSSLSSVEIKNLEDSTLNFTKSKLTSLKVNEDYATEKPGVIIASENSFTDFSQIRANVAELDISGNTGLTSLTIDTSTPSMYIRTLDASSCSLESLSVASAVSLTDISAPENTLTSANIQAAGLVSLDLHNNVNLGLNSFTIGSFSYTATRNSVTANGHPNGTSFYGYRLSGSGSVDWMEWLAELEYLDLSECSIKYFFEKSWGKGGGGTYTFYVRYGSVTPIGLAAFHKKYKADGLGAQNSRGYMQINDVTMSDHSVGSWGTTVGYKAVTYNGTALVGNSTLTLELPESLLKFTVYDQGTDAYSHDFCVVIYPFGP